MSPWTEHNPNERRLLMLVLLLLGLTAAGSMQLFSASDGAPPLAIESSE